MSDKARAGRASDDRDSPRKGARRTAARAADMNFSSINIDKQGREQQRRATAWGRARGQI